MHLVENSQKDIEDYDTDPTKFVCFVVELEFLPGREKLQGYDVRSLIKYQS